MSLWSNVEGVFFFRRTALTQLYTEEDGADLFDLPLGKEGYLVGWDL